MNAVIYARFSSDRQREASIEGQLRECREYAARNDIVIVGEYIDRALSASKETDKRLDFLRMIRDSSKHIFDAVLVWKMDRFARNRYDSAHYKNALKKNGVKVVSATEHITDGPEGIILESMLEGMAEYYSAELSEKIHRGQTENALKGLNNGGSVPFGYQINAEKRKLEINPVTAPIVKEIFTRYAAGDTIQVIKDDLNQRGIKTNLGFPFRYSTFSTILKNRKYIGEYRYRDIVIPNGVPGIISVETFNRVQKRLAKNKLTPAAAKASEPYILTTKLFCGCCGKMMAGESCNNHGKTYRYYKCSGAKRKSGCTNKPVKKLWMENLVVQSVVEMMMDDTLMDRITDRLVEIQGEENYDIKILQQRLKETKQSIEHMLDAIQAGIFTDSTKQRLTALENEKARTEQALIEAELAHPILTREQISFFLNQFKHTDMKDETQKQRLINSFINAIYVYDDKIVITFNYRDGTKTIPLKDIKSSDMKSPCQP